MTDKREKKFWKKCKKFTNAQNLQEMKKTRNQIFRRKKINQKLKKTDEPQLSLRSHLVVYDG